MIDLAKNYSVCAGRMKKNVIRELLKVTNNSEIISPKKSFFTRKNGKRGGPQKNGARRMLRT